MVAGAILVLYGLAGQLSPAISKKSVSVVIDFFGKHVQFYDTGDGTVECTLLVNREAMRRWAIQMAGTVKVISPPELVEDIREAIRKMAADYGV